MTEPYCLAMVLCDALHQDKSTGKFTLLGTFSTFTARQFPANLTCFIYFAITDGSGPTAIKVRVVDAGSSLVHDDEGAVFVAPENNVNFADPLMVIEGAAGFLNAKIPHPGLYHCELLANGQVLMARRLLALSINEQGETNDS